MKKLIILILIIVFAAPMSVFAEEVVITHPDANFDPENFYSIEFPYSVGRQDGNHINFENPKPLDFVILNIMKNDDIRAFIYYWLDGTKLEHYSYSGVPTGNFYDIDNTDVTFTISRNVSNNKIRIYFRFWYYEFDSDKSDFHYKLGGVAQPRAIPYDFPNSSTMSYEVEINHKFIDNDWPVFVNYYEAVFEFSPPEIIVRDSISFSFGSFLDFLFKPFYLLETFKDYFFNNSIAIDLLDFKNFDLSFLFDFDGSSSSTPFCVSTNFNVKDQVVHDASGYLVMKMDFNALTGATMAETNAGFLTITDPRGNSRVYTIPLHLGRLLAYSRTNNIAYSPILRYYDYSLGSNISAPMLNSVPLTLEEVQFYSTPRIGIAGVNTVVVDSDGNFVEAVDFGWDEFNPVDSLFAGLKMFLDLIKNLIVSFRNLLLIIFPSNVVGIFTLGFVISFFLWLFGR